MLSCYLLTILVYLSVATSSKHNAGIINFLISESASVGDVVGTLETMNISGSSKRQGDGPLFILQDTTYFSLIGSHQNTVVVNRLLDRDNDRKLCREPTWPEVCAWSGVLFAHDGVVLSLRITITDANDNIPRWPESALSKPRNSKDGKPAIELLIAENTPIRSLFDLPLADDRDYGKNGIVNYELITTENQGRFSLICTTGPNGVVPRLQVLEMLDREERDEYEMQIAAIDGGNQKTIAGLYVYLVDENDNSPIFTHLKNLPEEEKQRTKFVIEVDESIPVNSALPMHPVATDADSGDFGRVRYRFSFSTPEYVRRDFSIEPTTGNIIVQNNLDCDAGGVAEYVFSMVAEDSAPQPLTAVATVVIIVHDVNDNAPTISLTPATLKTDGLYDSTFFPSFEDSRDTFHLIEEMPSGQLVATVAVTDPDSDQDGEFFCDLGGSSDFTLHALPWIGATKVYQLLSARRFDREVEALISVTLKCVDRGNPPQASSKIIPITLIDVNDNRPYFQQPIYQFSIRENKPPGTLVGRVIVQDNDAGINGEVDITLSCKTGRHQHLFSINEKGEIRSNEVLDREANPKRIQFTVVAEDRGKPSFRTTAEVTIEIEDENDCSPKFAFQNYHFSIEEDQEAYRRTVREVGSVQAFDQDIGPNAEIQYLIEEPDSPFEISQNGTIYAVRKLDREVKSTYLLSVMAKDLPTQQFEKSLNSTTQVRVTITDINDHAPVFIFPRLNTSSDAIPKIKLSALEPIGHRIAKLQAKDADTGTNAKIRYSLLENSRLPMGTEKLFHLSEDSGELFIAAKLPTSKGSSHHLKVQATDGGSPPLSSTLSLQIVLDPTLPATSPGDSSGHDEGGDVLNNIYLIVIITFAVSIAFVILVIAIYFMSKDRRSKGYCCFASSSARNKARQLNVTNGLNYHMAGSNQIPDHSTPIGFTNASDYMTNLGSASYVLEKDSPLQCPPSEGKLTETKLL
ncbi:unnamed protein product [Rodentolepis nana]|uniref:Protocadherin-1 n=1 Tax=Rodentolepis nana TaxID=102285 RepID=A0A158QIB0_RODNA|nr:unnamed protein product [Rodentolepis nana]